MRGHRAIAHVDFAVLNSHHLLKLLAIISMTLDHIGAYLYPEDQWWRVMGRVAMPIFMFLVGHALSYRIQRDVVLWALVLMLTSPFLGVDILPLTILLTILCSQLLLTQVERHDWLTRCPWTLVVACVVLWFPSYIVMEYGTLAALYALMGYAVRSGKLHSVGGYAVTLLALVGTMGGMALSFDFNAVQLLVAMGMVTLLTIGFVYYVHRPVSCGSMPDRLQRGLRFLARHSLQYYVVHRIVLQAVGMVSGVLKPGLRFIS
jgi:hypothetical protein